MLRTPSPPRSSHLSSARGTALYVGALFGPSLLLLPGLAASIAGPASLIAWIGLLGLSGLLAWVFATLGMRFSGRGVVDYTVAGLGPRAGRAVSWCFLTGVLLGGPVVCLIGGAYVADLTGGGTSTTIVAAALLLLLVIGLSLGGARTASSVQLVLVTVLVALIVAAVMGALPSARPGNWTPFAPHGWTAIGGASSALMLAFVGWEAIAPLTARFRHPRRQLPRVIGTSFALTSVVYLALAITTVAVLGADSSTSVPLADLLRVGFGAAGQLAATVVAVALTLAACNAYLTGATAMLAANGVQRHALPLVLAGAGVLLLGGTAAGLVSAAELVAIPTTAFLVVYLGCLAAAARVLTGRVRMAAAGACATVACVLAFSGWALIPVLAVAGAAWFRAADR